MCLHTSPRALIYMCCDILGVLVFLEKCLMIDKGLLISKDSLPGVIWCVIGRISLKKNDRRRYSALLSICLFTRLSCSVCWYCCLHRQNRWYGILKMNCGVLCNYQVRILSYTPWRLLLLSKLCSMCTQLFDNFIITINNQGRFYRVGHPAWNLSMLVRWHFH